MILNYFRSTPLVIWFVCVVVFYLTWLFLVAYHNLWEVVIDAWPVSVSMAFGSYAAGSTPMGGGTVGFPLLVFLFDYPAIVGRDFSFAVQSVGMVSASIFILCRKQKLHWQVLIGAIIGAAIGTPIGLMYVAPHIQDVEAKYVFAIIWASFGLLHLYRINEICDQKDVVNTNNPTGRYSGFILGITSSVLIVSVTGVGIDMFIYILLILFLRCDLKTAIPTSVIIMAFTSLVGLGHQVITEQIAYITYIHWLAASPIVVLGAPLGALVVDKVGRKPTLLLIAALCLAQFIWISVSEFNQVGIRGMLISLGLIMVCIGLFELLRLWGLKSYKSESSQL